MTRGWVLAGALALSAAVLAAAGNAWLGTPRFAAIMPASATPGVAGASGGHDDRASPARRTSLADPAEVEARLRTLEALAEQMKSRPGDAEGWQQIGRSYAMLGRHAQAVAAYKTALALHPDDPTLLAESAFSAAVLEPRAASGEPARWTLHALELDPRHPKALALAGTLALDRKDYPGAIGYWERLAQVVAPGSPIAHQVQISIQQAQQLAARAGITVAAAQPTEPSVAAAPPAPPPPRLPPRVATTAEAPTRSSSPSPR